jgi:hypothetical protein
MLVEQNVEVNILYELSFLTRMVSFKDSGLSFYFWLKRKWLNFSHDRKILRILRLVDAIVVSECIPNGFRKQLYNIGKLKQITQLPIIIYEVYALENAPTQLDDLAHNNDPSLQLYDGHLYVSSVTEIRTDIASNSFCIGLSGKNWKLFPKPKKDMLALLDFPQVGFEKYRAIQVLALQRSGIPFIMLEGSYSIQAIREIYSNASIYFMQSFEAFGLPLLESLCTGTQIFTPDSGWPMSWRLDEKPEVHGPGILPDCFTVYDGEDDLLQKLLLFKENYNPDETPVQVFKEFIKHYSVFYEGDQLELNRCLDFLKCYKK